MQRMTKQREAILKQLSKNDRPLSLDEILSLVAKEVPTINRSTIYRNLKGLLEEGRVTVVTISKEKTCYERVVNGHRHHFLCDKCNRVFNIHHCVSGIHEIVPKGFQLTGHVLTLNGYCMECR
jgi:Fur family ferric uptake transcriptional regulator